MKFLSVVFIGIWLLVAVSWISNIVKFVGCDFEASYKCEAIHAIGLFPPASVVTVWLDTGK